MHEKDGELSEKKVDRQSQGYQDCQAGQRDKDVYKGFDGNSPQAMSSKS